MENPGFGSHRATTVDGRALNAEATGSFIPAGRWSDWPRLAFRPSRFCFFPNAIKGLAVGVKVATVDLRVRSGVGL